jgi:hypothetical protein
MNPEMKRKIMTNINEIKEIINNEMMSHREKLSNINFITEQTFNFNIALKTCQAIEESKLLKMGRKVTLDEVLGTLLAYKKAV